MKKYTLVVKKRVKKQLLKLPKNVAEMLKLSIDALADNPRPRML